MGLVASQARKLFLTARKSDLEFGMQKISQQRMNLSSQMQSIFNSQTNSSSSSSGNLGSTIGGAALGIAGFALGGGPIGASIGSAVGSFVGGLFGGGKKRRQQQQQAQQEAMLNSLQQKDKMLEMQMGQLETQHKAVSTEYESVVKIIDQNIKNSFKYAA